MSVLLLFISTTMAEASLVQVGTFGGGNCIPFGCPGVFSIGTYQQVYSSSAFPGPVTILGLTFFNTVPDAGNSLASGGYTFSLSTTSKSVGGLETTFANNLGPDDTVLFSGALGGPLGGTSFTVSGSPFDYDPASGNLLLTVSITGAEFSTGTFFDSNEGSGVPFSRMYPGFSVEGDSGLVTTFEVQDEAVPEPSALLLSGFGLLALVLSRRRKS